MSETFERRVCARCGKQMWNGLAGTGLYDSGYKVVYRCDPNCPLDALNPRPAGSTIVKTIQQTETVISEVIE